MKKKAVAEAIASRSQKLDLRPQAQKPGIYDALLFVSLGFLLMGIVFLFLELYHYEFVISP